MKTFTPAFDAAKNKKRNAPVCLLQLDWPSINGLPAKTLRFTDRHNPGDRKKYTAAGEDWLNLISGFGDIDRQVDEEDLHINQDADYQVRIVNADADLGGTSQQTLSELFLTYPPYAAKAALYQWFHDEGFVQADWAPLFVARVQGVDSVEEKVSINFKALSGFIGKEKPVQSLTSTAYPNAPSDALGKPIPIVIGQVENVRGILVTKIPETELTATVIPGATVINVKDTSDFSTSGKLQLDNDVISYTGKTATSFTGCATELSDGTLFAGIDEAHYDDDVITQKLSVFEYLFFDPNYPGKSLTNPRWAGHLQSSGFTVDLGLGTVAFDKRPRKRTGSKIELLEAQFDETNAANTALDPASAYDKDAVTDLATINSLNPELVLDQTTPMKDRGNIKRAWIQVEHYEEAELPNDELEVHLDGPGLIDTLKKPNANDAITVAADVDVVVPIVDTKGGLVDIGGTPIDDNIGGTTDLNEPLTDDIETFFPGTANFIDVQGDGENSTSQFTTTLLDATLYKNFPQTLIFPAAPAGTSRILYKISLGQTPAVDAPTFSGGNPGDQINVGLDGSAPIFGITGAGNVYEFIEETETSLASNFGTSVTLKLAGFTTFTAVIKSATRVCYVPADYSPSSAATPLTPNDKEGGVNNLVATKTLSKTGGVTDIPAGTNKSLVPSGSITASVAVTPVANVVAEKSSTAVIEQLEITDHVTDWTWFKNQTVRVKYVGGLDGRSSYIVHVAFLIEYAVPEYEDTDDVTCDVEGCVDDATGFVTGTPSALIERPDHVFLWSLKKVAGLVDSEIDLASFSSAGTLFAAAIAGGYKFGGVIVDDTDLKKLWRVWEKECRSYLDWNDAGQARFNFRPVNDSTGVAVDKVINESVLVHDQKPIRPKYSPPENIINSVEALYDYDRAFDSFAGAENQDDVFSQSFYEKKLPEDEMKLFFVRDQAMCIDLIDFMLKEHAWPNLFVEFQVMLDQIELDRGDVVSLTTDINKFVSKKAQVINVSRQIGSGKDSARDALLVHARIFPDELFDSPLAAEADGVAATAPLSWNEINAPWNSLVGTFNEQ